MKRIMALCATLTLSAPATADETVDPAIVAKIEALLASMECQMDPDDIEIEEDGYELDDVICKGGDQFDIALDKDLKEVGRRAE
ncbi:MAG: PepSY domain-containing protein [Roseobacter sp.]